MVLRKGTGMGRAGNATAWLCIGTWLLAGGAATAADWPQWRGPLRNGVSTEPLPLDQWAPQAGPPVLWRAAVGRGHSAISVADGRAFTLGWDGSQDTVWCFDASDGKLIWKRSYDSGDIKQWPGPRATPTISGAGLHAGAAWLPGLLGRPRRPADLECPAGRELQPGRRLWDGLVAPAVR